MQARITITTEITGQVGEHITTVSTTIEKNIGGNPTYMRGELRPVVDEMNGDQTPNENSLLSRHYAALTAGIGHRG